VSVNNVSTINLLMSMYRLSANETNSIPDVKFVASR